MSDLPLLSLIIWLPAFGAVLLLVVKGDTAARWVGFGVSALVLVLFAACFGAFKAHVGDPQFVERMPWIESLGVSYHVGADGISILLAGITALMWPLALLGTWTIVGERVRAYQVFMLLMETTLMGVFFSLDLFLFFIFWEGMLIPMYFLIGIWGYGNRARAALKFFLFAVFGSLLMLAAVITLAFLYHEANGVLTFEIAALYQLAIPPDVQFWLALAFIAAFAVKVPMVPFHTWLPDAIVLAVVLVKMAAYGFIRLTLPMFPDALAELAPLMCVVAAAGIVYGALIALAQSDIRKLIAYSTISHAGFVVLGVFALNQHGIQGAVVHIVSLALSTGGLFLAAMMLAQRRDTWDMDAYGGLWHTIPVFSAFLLVFTLASVGLPGLSNFVGEFLILVGVFQNNALIAIVAATGIILAAAYMLRMYRKIVFGPLTREENRGIRDLSFRETAVLACMTLFIIWIGVYPNPFLRTMEASVQKLLVQTHRLAETSPAGMTRPSIGPATLPAIESATLPSIGSATLPAGLDAARETSQDTR